MSNDFQLKSKLSWNQGFKNWQWFDEYGKDLRVTVRVKVRAILVWLVAGQRAPTAGQCRQNNNNTTVPPQPMGVRGRPVHPPDKQTNNPASTAKLSTTRTPNNNAMYFGQPANRNSCWRNYRATLGRQQQLGHSNKQLRQLGTQQIQTRGWLQKLRKLWQFFLFNEWGGGTSASKMIFSTMDPMKMEKGSWYNQAGLGWLLF